MAQMTFKRVEKKYFLDLKTYAAFRRELEYHMSVDEYGKSTICNIYYDADDFNLIYQSIEKPVYKEKFRLRSYGVPCVDSPIFAEIKKKYKGIVYKRRITASYREIEEFLATGKVIPSADPQISREIQYFINFHQCSPKVFIAYDRTALFGKQDPSLRVTFDQDIRWRNDHLDLRCGDSGSLLFNDGRILMEIKIPGAAPLWLCELLDKYEIRNTSFSKYGTVYQKHFDEITSNGILIPDQKLGEMKEVKVCA